MTRPTDRDGARARHISVTNRQRDCPVNGPQLRRTLGEFLDRQLGLAAYRLALHLVSRRRMAELNQKHLNHLGPTDVITFDYSEPTDDGLVGEILVCPWVALRQAKAYRTTWEAELLRYAVHGILHLQGYDDRNPADRRTMKREEDRLVRALLRTHSARAIRR